MPNPSPLVIGHRGAPGHLPEHTRASYELAFACGVDAVEPDVVPTRDGVLVVRHENEISGTTDVAEHPEFGDRRTTKTVDGERITGWFTEDFTWDELSRLRCRERLPELRPQSARADGQQGMLRLSDLLGLTKETAQAQGREIGIVLEIKHATFFTALGYDLGHLVAAELRRSGWAEGEHPLIVESFEETVLHEVRARGIVGEYVYLLENPGTAADLLALDRGTAPSYRDQRRGEELRLLADRVDGISVDKRVILTPGAKDRGIVQDAQALGLRVFVWTCRPENAFLLKRFRRGASPGAFGDFEKEWGLIRDSGVDGVFVDHPDLGTAFFRA